MNCPECKTIRMNWIDRMYSEEEQAECVGYYKCPKCLQEYEKEDLKND